MPSANFLPLFQAAVRNVRALKHGISIFRQDLNRRLCRDSVSELHLYTKIYATLFSVWAEAALAKMIFVPYGFTDIEIEQVQRAGSNEDRWRACLKIGFAKSDKGGEKSLQQTLGPKLDRLISNYIVTPANLRNKIAHGQWAEAFNNKGTTLNPDTTTLLRLVDIVEVDRWFFVFGELSKIVLDAVESPERALRRDAWRRLTSIEEEMERRKGWTVESKRECLRRHKR